MKKRKSKSWSMAYCGMAAALCVALMLLGTIIPIAMFIAPAVASFLIATVCMECGITMAWTAYAAVSLLGLLFVPDKEIALIFTVLLGYYPLVKPRFDRIRPRALQLVCKLLLCNAAVLAMYGLLLVLVPAGSVSQELRTTALAMSLLTLSMGNVAFALYDRALCNLLLLYKLTPVVVPDTEDHQLDVASFERSINRMIDAGVDGLFFLGSSGEVVFSTDERRRQIIAEAVRIVDHRVPVLVGIIDTETERMIEHGKVAQELGADALVATCPFYALQGMTEVEEHFRILHEELDLPIFAYDIPVCVHTKLPWKLLAKLGAEGVLAGVKDSSGDDISFRYLVQENEKNGHPMSILTGHEVVVDGA